MQKKYALISVSDKTEITKLATTLVHFGYTLLSTGGTAKELRGAGFDVIDVSDFTGFPECFEGRVKTLHPKVHGAILHVRGNKEHEAKAKQLGIDRIDFVVVNLYPFQATIARGADFEKAIENIDIGGPAMLRSAAKNHESVTVVCNPADYDDLIRNLHANNGETSPEFRLMLAAEVFEETSRYDMAIGGYLRQQQATKK